MFKVIDEFKSSVRETYKREGLFAAAMWAAALPVFMVASVITDAIYNA